MEASAHLLRTLASVAPGTFVLDLAAGDGRHLVPLAQLGLDVHGATDRVEQATNALATVLEVTDARQRVVAASATASGFPSRSAAWVALSVSRRTRSAALAEAFRVLEDGGWVWVETDTLDGLEDEARRAGLVVAESPSADKDGVHAIFRRPGSVA